MKLGGLTNMADVKAMILYIMNYTGRPLSYDNLADIVLYDELVEYFDFTAAMDELLNKGLIDILSPDETRTYKITSLGQQTVQIYEKNLPFNVRKKNVASVIRVLAQIERDKQIKTDIQKENGGYLVTCTLMEGEQLLMEYKILVPNELQAHLIAEQFKSDPTPKYQGILSLLIDEKLFDND